MKKSTSGSLIYVLMPFDPESNWVYEMSVRPACEDAGFTYERVSSGVFEGDADERLLEDAQLQIERAHVVITDMTTQAPALFYLTGYAYTLRKKVIPIVAARRFLPPSFRDRRPLVYGGRGDKFTSGLERRIRRLVEPPRMAQRILRRTAETSDAAEKRAAEPSKVFISYSHKNRWWLNKLKVMCAPMVSNRKMELWDDTRIKSGDEWRPAIQAAVMKSKVAVLMVSAEFLASEFIMKKELPYLLRAARQGRLKVLWVLLSACLYDETKIPSYQAAHDISRSLASLSPSKRDEVLRDICLQIGKALEA